MYRRVIAVLVVLSTVMIFPNSLTAQSSTLVISELQTGSLSSASQEFVELQNVSAATIDVAGWKLEYKSATSANSPTNWDKHADLTGTIAAGEYFLVTTKSYLANADAAWSDGMASAGGHVRLVDSHGAVIDLVGYGTANSPETAPAAAPAAGKSIARKLDDSDLAVDTDSNSNDFSAAATPTPGSAPTTSTVPSSTPVPSSGTTTTTGATPSPSASSSSTVDLSALKINELFVDPAAPLSDSKDEFIELVNTSETAISLTGLKLQTGSNFHDSYTIPASTIVGGGYLAFYSSVTKLALTNSGGAARLITASGQLVDSTTSYGIAPSGQTWANFEDGWHWTTTATPGAANLFTAAIIQAKAVASTTSSTSRVSATKTATSRVAAATKAVKASASKTAKAVAAASSAIANTPVTSNNGRWLLFGLAGLTIGYGLYEYRHRIYNFIEISKRYLRARRKAGKVA